MSCALFEIGILDQDALMLLRSGWSAAQIEAALGWLSRENARGAHIFVRPHSAHALSVIDDLNAEGIDRLRFRRPETVMCLSRTIDLASGDCAH